MDITVHLDIKKKKLMFHEVRRIKQIISKEECYQILEEELRGVLSVVTEDGYPYGMTMNHYLLREENRIYFHSSRFGHKMDCIRNNNKCSFTVIQEAERDDANWYLSFKSVVVFGKVHFLEDKKKIAGISRLLSYKFTKDEDYIDDEIKKYLDATAMFYIEIEHITGKLVKEH